MRHWPINSVASLVLDGVTVSQSTDGIMAGWYLDLNTDPENINTLSLVDYLFTRLSTVTIVYNAGYVAVPADLTQAAIEWVAARYQGRTAAGTSSIKVTEGRSQSEQATFVPFDMPRATKRVAERYKTNSLALMFSANND
jgi:FAD/FMN-containing dehydrogenase